MTAREFWIDHFAPADPALEATFLALSLKDSVEVLEELGFARAQGVVYESAENRVFGFGEVVLKFFRPGRWSLAALQDEVQFLDDLREAKIPFVRAVGGVRCWRGLFCLVYEAIPSPHRLAPEVLSEDSVRQMAHLVARIHDVGSLRSAPARPQFDPVGMSSGCFEVIKRAGFLPGSLQLRYQNAIDQLVAKITELGEIPVQRIHGDTYIGNTIWLSQGPLYMDLDDFQVGPVALDLRLMSSSWRLDTLPASMDRSDRRIIQQELVLKCYRELRPFPQAQERLFPLLSALRDIQFDAWFSARWDDPGFSKCYPNDDIRDPIWWSTSIESLETSVNQ